MRGRVRFSNSNRIIPSDYRILLLLKIPIANGYPMFFVNIGPNSRQQRENGANQKTRQTWVYISLCFHLSLLKSTLPRLHTLTTRSTAHLTHSISSKHSTLSSVESYLTGRSFIVAWGGEESRAHQLVTGVPQGSVLGLGVDRYVFFRADADTDYYRSSRPITDILNQYTCLV